MVVSNDVTIIWGSTGAISNEANNIITLPIALKNRLYSISALAYSVDGKTTRNEYGIYILQMSKASFLTSLKAFNGVAINVPIRYIAVGF